MKQQTEGAPPQPLPAQEGEADVVASAPVQQTAFLGRVPKSFGDLQKTITMAQIARAAGVSQGAISSLLNDRDYGIRVSEKTRERVFKVCREMGYLPNDLRAVVRMYPELGDFCLLVSSRASEYPGAGFTSRIILAALEAVPQARRSLTLSHYDPDFDYAASPEMLPHPIAHGVVSKILILGTANSSLITALNRRGMQAAHLAHDVQQAGVMSFLPDYAAASRMAIEHLNGLGHRRIAILSGVFGATDARTIELSRGIRTAYDEMRVPIEAQNIVYGDLSARAGASAFSVLRGRPDAPTAIFCMTDEAAAGVLAEAQRAGLHVPRDLSVVGCGNEHFSSWTAPALTTIHIPAEELAVAAVMEIGNRVDSGQALEMRRILVQPKLEHRESTAAPVK